MKVLNSEDQNISDEQMRSISAKTMIIVGDADGVKPEHALAMFKLRGGGDVEAAASRDAAAGSGRPIGDPASDVATCGISTESSGARADGQRVPR